MGAFVPDILWAQVVKVSLRTYGGKAANIEAGAARQVIMATVMKGLLHHTKECKTLPSLINAPFLSGEMGIETFIDDKVGEREREEEEESPCRFLLQRLRYE